MAGGLTNLADIHVTIHRRSGLDQIVAVDLPNNPTTSIRSSVAVAPGDQVVVPKAGIVYVLGDVGRPGGYVMQNDGKLTVLQAVALAAGTTRTASERSVRLVRKTDAGLTEYPVPLHDMQTGKKPDLALQAEDVLYIPDSSMKNLMLGASAVMASVSGAAIYTTR